MLPPTFATLLAILLVATGAEAGGAVVTPPSLAGASTAEG